MVSDLMRKAAFPAAVLAAVFLFSCMEPALAGNRCGARGVPDTYKGHFRKAVHQFWPAEYRDYWCWWMAQCYVESHLREGVRSPAGAEEICQQLPATLNRILKRSPLAGHSSKTVQSIRAGAEMMGDALRRWDARGRRMRHVLPIGQAIYNAGEGHILKAQALSGDRRDWPDIAPYLVCVTGRHAEETLNYVARIDAAHRMLGGRPWSR